MGYGRRGARDAPGTMPDRFPDVDLSDPDLPLRIQFDTMCPLRDEENEKQVNITVGALRVFLRIKTENKRYAGEMLLFSLSGGKIVRSDKDGLPYFMVGRSTRHQVTIGRELREAIMRHILANPLVGKYCRDKRGKGGKGQWEKSQASTALYDLLLEMHSSPQSKS